MRPISSLTATARDNRRHRRPLPPHAGAARRRRGRRAGAGRWSRCCARSTPPAPSAKRRWKRQREFVADASHELRTPLTSILANLELLQASLEVPAAGGRAGDGRLGAALLEPHEPPRRRPAAPRPRRRRADRRPHRAATWPRWPATPRPRSRRPIGERELRVENERPLRVDGNPDELHRLVLNLLDNAARHTPAGLADRAAAARRGPRAVVEVADDGPGVPLELREQIFERFVRGDRAGRHRVGIGSGLGLAIVSAVATSHGGSAEVGESDLRRRPLRVRLPRSARLSGELPCFRPALAPRLSFPAGRDTRARRFSPTRPAGPFISRRGLDLDDDRQDHRPAAQLLVDELGDRVVEVFLDQVHLAGAGLGGVLERVLDARPSALRPGTPRPRAGRRRARSPRGRRRRCRRRRRSSRRR